MTTIYDIATKASWFSTTSGPSRRFIHSFIKKENHFIMDSLKSGQEQSILKCEHETQETVL